jgi:hypothetical protein
MPTDTAVWVASITGFLGAIVVTCIGARFTRNLRVLVCGGIFSGAASGELMYALWGWFAHGFELSKAGVPLLAALILLLVMAAQNWFVFYEDRRDALQSSLPALVMLTAAGASVLAGIVAGKHSFSFRLVWASAGSLALLLCIDPVQRSIERTRSVLLGTLVGIGKILVPFTGIVIFLRRMKAVQPEPENIDGKPAAVVQQRFLINFVGLFWDLGLLVLTILINGARIAPRPATFDPFEIQGQQKSGQSISGEMSRLKRDSVVVIFVLAIHVLCGVAIVKA